MTHARNLAFDWDSANMAHIARHGVAASEAEDVIRGGSVPIGAEERGDERRHAELGVTSSGRLLIVVWTWRKRRIRVVTAFPANRKWRAFWMRSRPERSKGDGEKESDGSTNRG